MLIMSGNFQRIRGLPLTVIWSISTHFLSRMNGKTYNILSTYSIPTYNELTANLQ